MMDGEPSLVIDIDRAAFVRQAFELMATDNVTVKQVLAKVTAMGLTTRSGKSVTPQTFGALLRKPTCMGVLAADRTF
jgi:hypothetical protein